MTVDEMYDALVKAGYPPCMLVCSIALIKNGRVILKTKKSGNHGDAVKRLYEMAKERKII